MEPSRPMAQPPDGAVSSQNRSGGGLIWCESTTRTSPRVPTQIGGRLGSFGLESPAVSIRKAEHRRIRRLVRSVPERFSRPTSYTCDICDGALKSTGDDIHLLSKATTHVSHHQTKETLY